MVVVAVEAIQVERATRALPGFPERALAQTADFPERGRDLVGRRVQHLVLAGLEQHGVARKPIDLALHQSRVGGVADGFDVVAVC